MLTTRELLDDFHRYATSILGQEADEPTLDELYDAWRFEHLNSQDLEENLSAVRASLADFENGEKGTPAGVHSQQLRREFGITTE